MTVLELLADVTRRGIELVADGDRLLCRPQAALTADLVGRLRSHKGELLALLRNTGGPGGGDQAAEARRLREASGVPPPGVAPGPGECPRCRSTGFRDVPIHNGQSVRRDCARCGRFIAFVVWYGRLMQPGAN
jgi:hypothetical protein